MPWTTVQQPVSAQPGVLLSTAATSLPCTFVQTTPHSTATGTASSAPEFQLVT